MTQNQFNALPLLLRVRHPALAEWKPRPLRDWIEDGDVTSLRLNGAHSHLYVVRATLAPLLGLHMDWSAFEGWPLRLTWSHLLESGLNRYDLARMLEKGQLTECPVPRHHKYPKETLARLVGYGVNPTGERICERGGPPLSLK